MLAPRFLALGLSGLVISTACTARAPNTDTRATDSVEASIPSMDGSAPPPSSLSTPDASATAKAVDEQESRRARFASLVDDLSEPDTYFFSDNVISNETSYLQVARDLAATSRPEGVYVGVGPEQNFTYIAMTKPSLAFIVDIRRQNLMMHLLYKAAFEEARSRSHFLALVLGRDHDASRDGSPSDGIDEVLALVQKDDFGQASYDRAHALLMKRIRAYGVKLSSSDEKLLDAAHHALFEGQLETRFALKEKNGRSYPTLKDLLGEKTPEGKTDGFLASEQAFRFVQTMEREHRVIPLVGDFAGDKALPGLAAFLQKEGKTVSAFYVSNVEQYLLDPPVWAKWTRNVKALPKDDTSLFIRAYLDQGKRHPLEMKGHRTATVLQLMRDFEVAWGEKKTTTLWDLSTEHLVSSK